VFAVSRPSHYTKMDEMRVDWNLAFHTYQSSHSSASWMPECALFPFFMCDLDVIIPHAEDFVNDNV